MTDVLIAGGGVAGASLARLLGRAGLTVELFERSPMPREKPCGEGLMPAGVRALERWGLVGAVGGAPFRGVRYRLGEVVAEARFPAVDGWPALGRGQRRYHLDRVLFEAAAATPGVRVHAGVAVEAPVVEDGRVVGLVADGGERRGRLVVAADGLRSPLRRQLGLDAATRRSARVGVRTHFRLAAGQPAVPWVEVYVGCGYELYVTPLPDRELLVAGLAEPERVRGGAAASLCRWIAEQPVLATRLDGAEPLTPLQGRAPLAATARAGWVPGCVLLGDAAGYVDPITGGGMSQAMLTAELLAAHAPRLVAGDWAAAAAFERDRQALLWDYRWLTELVLALSRRPTLAAAAIRLLRAAPVVMEHLVGVGGGTRRLLPSAA